MVFAYLFGESTFAPSLGLFRLWNRFLISVHLGRLEQCSLSSQPAICQCRELGILKLISLLSLTSSLACGEHKFIFSHCGLEKNCIIQ